MFDSLPYLSFFPFFSLSLNCYPLDSKKRWKKHHLLLDTSSYLNEEKFADLYWGWQEGGLCFRLEAKKAFEHVDRAEYKNGDALEIFLDTRDLKSKGLSAFCHHFVFFPEKVGGYLGKEITQFHSSEIHPLCDPKELGAQSELLSSRYFLDIEIPASCLYGFDPARFDRLGFAYRLHRPENNPQNFSLSSFEFSLETQPTFWSSAKMVKEKERS
jgi:hypothetical protein